MRSALRRASVAAHAQNTPALRSKLMKVTALFCSLLLTSMIVAQTIPDAPTSQPCAGLACGGHKKLAHFLGGFYIGEMGVLTGHKNIGLLAGFAVGVGKEVYDNYHGNEGRMGHVKDVAITTSGARNPLGHCENMEALPQAKAELLRRCPGGALVTGTIITKSSGAFRCFKRKGLPVN